MNRKKTSKQYWEMTTEELQKATKEFDAEFVADRAKPMTPEMKARWERAKAKPPRAANGHTKKRKTQTYTVFFVPDETGGYTAHVPALSIVTEGETLAKARAMARDAISGRIARLRELKQPIPKDLEPEHIEVRV